MYAKEQSGNNNDNKEGGVRSEEKTFCLSIDLIPWLPPPVFLTPVVVFKITSLSFMFWSLVIHGLQSHHVLNMISTSSSCVCCQSTGEEEE